MVLGLATQVADEGGQATTEEENAGQREANHDTQNSEQSYFAARTARSPGAPEKQSHAGEASCGKKDQRGPRQLRHETQFSIAEALFSVSEDTQRR